MSLGQSVAISGSTAVVGAPSTAANTGAAYVFVRVDGVWSQQAELLASDGAMGDNFGSSVAISGSWVVVGAPTKNTFKGAAYVFARNNGAWTEQAILSDPAGGAYNQFGWAVSISGSTALVSAPFKHGTGVAYLFRRAGSAWTHLAPLAASDGSQGDGFGVSAALSGSTAVIGAPYRASYTGAAYVFNGSGSSWTQQAELDASDGLANDTFGTSVAVAGSFAVVGAYGTDSGAGSAYVFVGPGGVWSEQAELTASDRAHGNFFGGSVTISGSTVAVGADDQRYDFGAVYVFGRATGTWSQEAELTASDGGHIDHFGTSVALDRTTMVIGASGHDLGQGAAYVFASGAGGRSDRAVAVG
jgi:hypothetical protein